MEHELGTMLWQKAERTDGDKKWNLRGWIILSQFDRFSNAGKTALSLKVFILYPRYFVQRFEDIIFNNADYSIQRSYIVQRLWNNGESKCSIFKEI